MLQFLLLFALLLSLVVGAPLRSQLRIGGSNLVPVRVEILRSCGHPVDLSQPISGFACDTRMHRVALACADTHTRYICDRTLWRAIGK